MKVEVLKNFIDKETGKFTTLQQKEKKSNYLYQEQKNYQKKDL